MTVDSITQKDSRSKTNALHEKKAAETWGHAFWWLLAIWPEQVHSDTVIYSLTTPGKQAWQLHALPSDE